MKLFDWGAIQGWEIAWVWLLAQRQMETSGSLLSEAVPSVCLDLWGDIEFAWSGQVYESIDNIPFLGRNPGNDNPYVITGDSEEGLTAGVAGALIISALVEHGECLGVQS
jgi:hypothetical protein